MLFKRYGVLCLVVLIWIAFCASLMTACGPGARIVLFPGWRLPTCALLGGVMLVSFFAACLAVLKRRHLSDPWAGVNRTLWPAVLLGIYPFVVFVLHPLGVPLGIAILVKPKFLVLMAVLLGAWQLFRETGWWDLVWNTAEKLAVDNPLGRVKLVLFSCCLLFYGTVTALDNRCGDIVGDEPHYLIMSRSLATYHTLDLAKIMGNKRLDSELARVRLHRSSQSRKGTSYSVHHAGLPALLCVPHLLAGSKGVMFFFNVIAALLVVNIFGYTHDITGNLRRSLLVAGLMALTCPIAFYFRFIYPDMVAALFVLFSFRILCRREQHTLFTVTAALCAAAFLPWLHVKYLLFTLTLPLVYGLTGRIEKRHVLVAAACYGISALAMMCFFSQAYGSFLPDAQYGGDSPPVSRFFGRGAAGLFWDQDHGLLAFSPYFVLAIPGMVEMYRRHRRELLLILLMTVPTFVTAASHWMWWGGPCPAGRFLLPLIVLSGPLVAFGVGRDRGSFQAAFVFLAVVVSLVFGLRGIQYPAMTRLHNHIGCTLFTGLKGYPPLPVFFIHHTQSVPVSSYALLALWMLPVFALFTGAPRRTPPAGRPPGGILCGGGFLACLAVLLLCPGLYSLAHDALSARNAPGMDADRRFARLNYEVENYFMNPVAAGGWELPAAMARCVPGLVWEAAMPISNTVSRSEDNESRGSLSPSVTLLRGALFPLHYSVVAEAVAEAGALPVARLEAACGQEVLAAASFAPKEGPATRSAAISFQPGGPRHGVLRCVLGSEGVIGVRRVRLNVSTTTVAGP